MHAAHPDKLLYLDGDQVARLCRTIDPLDVVADAFLAVRDGRAGVTPEAALRWSAADGTAARSLILPAWHTNAYGCKVINACIGNPDRGLPRANGLIILNDPDTALPVCLMEGAHISALRTAAVSLAALRTVRDLAEIRQLALLGCGRQARTHLELLAARAPLEKVTVYDCDPARGECHGLTYAFRGHGAANGSASRPGAKLVDVARRAGVSTGTVSNVLNRPDTVAEPTRLRVLEAIADLGYIRNAASAELAAHWRRSGFATWLFQPAATGRYPKRGDQEEHPVPLVAEPWPGIPARGRGATGRAQACWLPIAPGLTPHGLRYTHKTLMREAGTPPKLMDERMGHEDGSVQARYDHITPGMRRTLMAALTEMWEEALDARRTMSAGSPVAVLDALLRTSH